ncbi:MAG: ExeM/NucH family extracellular endonuclease [Anaerolineae bacterium]|nr:ExeM/NucH family extracellular endonuclease [Anaerolineae bacterium]
MGYVGASQLWGDCSYFVRIKTRPQTPKNVNSLNPDAVYDLRLQVLFLKELLMTSRLWLRLLCVVIVLAVAPSLNAFVNPRVVIAATYTEGFDVASNWTCGGSGCTSYATHTYADATHPEVTFRGELALRQTSVAQDGYSGTHSGDYAWRLQNATGSLWQAKITTGGVGTFSVWVRRWESSPDPNYVVEYSIDNGTSWTTVQTINNTWLGSSDWRQVSGVINTSNGAGDTDDILIQIRRTAGERLMVDDFEMTDYTGEAAPAVSTTTPASGVTGVAVDADISVTFSEAVNVAGSWYLISCASSGAHTAAVTGGPTTFTLNPDSDFANGESCTVTLYAAQITDQDTDDPPDTMAADYSWSFTVVASGAPAVLINEVDADTPDADVAEFIELYDGGTGNTSLTGLVIVLFNGNGDVSYSAFDLDGRSTNSSGYFVICGDSANVANCDWDVTPNQDLIQNGADAVALYQADAGDFPNGTAVTTADLVDALVYDTSDTDDAGLLVLLNTGETQVNEDGQGDSENHSNQRCPNGTGGGRNTSSYDQATPTPGAANVCGSGGDIGICGDGTETAIHAIQGSGASSPMAGTSGVVIEGIVVGDFQNTTTELSGFFVQEESADMDGDANTSEGIFVYDNGFGVDVDVGDVVRVLGNVTEYYNLTEMNGISAIEVCDSGTTPSTPDVTLPFTDAADLEKYEGMLVTFPQTLYVSGNYQLGRYGEVVLSSGARLDTPTNVVAPGAAAVALQAQNDLNRIILDDDNLSQNVDPIDHPAPGLTASNTLRSGDTVSNLVGVVSYSWSGYTGTDNYRLHPVGAPNFVHDNPRPAVTTSDSSQVRVASFNVLNYFVTFGSRGAEDQTEFDRQRAKIISAITSLDADVVGLMEIENHSTDAALQDLVDGLNTATAAGTYAYVDTGVLGTDEIKVALIYKPGRVSLVGSELTNTDAVFSRPPIAQTFQQTSQRFTVIVNHFKSKGCSGATGDDADQGDGQGCYNATRVDQANALTTWINATVIPNASGANGDADVVIIGDLNAYAMEDPITAIKGAGYVDMLNTFTGAGAYSYVYDNQSGYLDHALASNSLAPWVADVQEWHINADEPIALDYNTNYKTANQLTTLYAPDAYRASDHDPVLVLLDFVNVYVDDDYTTSTLGWDVNRFDAIQSGIDAATVGQTVYVENLSAGAEETYAESVALNKDVNLVIRDDIRLNGALAITAGNVVAPAGTLTLAGNFTHNAGTFSHNDGTVVFDGVGPWAYAGNSTTFYNLTINAGTILDAGPGFAVAGTVTNNGALRQTHNVGTDNTIFLNISTDRYYGVEIDPDSTAMGDTTVTIGGNQFCSGATLGVERCFEIDPAYPQAATVHFYFTEAERNGETLADLQVWHWSGSAWARETGTTSTGGSGDAQWVQVTDVDEYSPFSLSENTPTAVDLASFDAIPQDNAILVTWETASELDNVGFNLYRSASSTGPYALLNATLIPPQNPGMVLGGYYEWLDTGVIPGITYYYKLEDIDMRGVSTFHGPVGSTIASAPAAVGLHNISAHHVTMPLTLVLATLLGLVIVHAHRRRDSVDRNLSKS